MPRLIQQIPMDRTYRVFLLFFSLHLLCYAVYASRHLLFSSAEAGEAPSFAPENAFLMQTGVMIPALAIGILLAAQLGFFRVNVSWLHYAGLAVAVTLAFPLTFFVFLPVAALLGAVSDLLGDTADRIMTALGVFVLLIPASTIPLTLWLCLRSATGKWDPHVLLWMLVCMVVVFVFSFFAGELPAMKQRGGAWALMFPLLGATWIGQVGWGLMRASGRAIPVSAALRCHICIGALVDGTESIKIEYLGDERRAHLLQASTSSA